MKAHVVAAIFLRNLKSYFSNPAGYVFITIFSIACAVAAFLPHEFFNANLANFDQLSWWLPYILMVFIPAITMSVWADERRQGTDELLLTIPATDFDVVLGKYLAAVAIYSVALLFATISFLWLMRWGDPDWGLIVSTYFGYWLVGVTMLAIGMTASFLTGNLTVAFILGVVFNLPLVAIHLASAIPLVPESVKNLSIQEQLRDFSQGVINFSSLVYFGLAIVVSLYLCLVLIGRRHWMGGRDGHSMLGHYIVRAVALIGAAVGLYAFVAAVPLLNRARLDVTSERLSSLSPRTKELLRSLDAERAVAIDAYISPEVPEAYVQQRLNLLSRLREFESLAGGKVKVRIHATQPRTDEAQYAEQQFDIVPRQVPDRSRGRFSVQEVFLGVAFSSGLNKVVVPFFDKGVPVEYELVRSVATVSQQERKKVGVLTTDARLYGSFNFQTGGMSNNEAIVTELEKQYEVVQVSADGPISDEYDVLLAVQPSSLGPEQMPNFLAAVKAGMPTAIFEDPLPYLNSGVPGTTIEKEPPGGMQAMMMGQQPPMPKGDITPLWNMLGINFSGAREVGDSAEAVWQDYFPYPEFGEMPLKEFWVFVSEGASDAEPFNRRESIAADLQQLLFLVPGYIERLAAAEDLNFHGLVYSGDRNTGAVSTDKMLTFNQISPDLPRFMIASDQQYTLAAYIHGRLPQDQAMQDAESAPAAETDGADDAAEAPGAAASRHAPGEINVAVVADIDLLFSAFFALRERGGGGVEGEVPLNFDNVTFVLNVLDMLAGDDRFITVRGRRPAHRTLTAIEKQVQQAKDKANAARQDFEEEFKLASDEAQKAFDKKIAEIEKRTDIDEAQKIRTVLQVREVENRRLKANSDRLKLGRDRKIREAEREEETTIDRVQNFEKGLAILVSPILPALLGLGVFIVLRVRETEGVSKSRLR